MLKPVPIVIHIGSDMNPKIEPISSICGVGGRGIAIDIPLLTPQNTICITARDDTIMCCRPTVLPSKINIRFSVVLMLSIAPRFWDGTSESGREECDSDGWLLQITTRRPSKARAKGCWNIIREARERAREVRRKEVRRTTQTTTLSQRRMYVRRVNREDV
jgi:hypothetical protein